MEADTLGWKESMDRFASEKEAARAQLSLVESQLRGMKDKSTTQAKKIEELEARLASELAKAKSEAEKAKAEAEAIVAVYRADAKVAQVQAREATKTAQTRAHWIVEIAMKEKSTSQEKKIEELEARETLEEIHARGFDLTDEIIKAREHEDDDAGALASSDDDGNKSGSKNGEDFDGGEAASEEN
ncbi:uncharacterized protein [Nicotiana tomentosiformis]|uniref:uncharacterized protein n=1 Tax=Nicotiana tomentosiformis TaxID=4098 RepID=UPI00388C89AF